jgi:hypothetical protein
MSKSLIICLLLLGACLSLDVAINSMEHRCMVVYTTSQDDHLKIDIKFSKLKV